MQNSINHTGRAHALLSASGASRWMKCTPSARLEEEYPSQSSVFAQEGTLAHEFAETILRRLMGQIDENVYLATLENLRSSELYTDEMEEQVQKYVDHVIESYAEAKSITPDALMLIEEKVDLTHYIEDGFGSCDDVIIADNLLIVEDLKYGKGVRVDAQDNSQLKLYALGALRRYEMHYDIETVRMSIIQPRLDHISTWEISAKDLVAWGETVVKPTAKKAYAGEGEFCAGDWCRWCKAAPKCKALADFSIEVAKTEFINTENPKESDPSSLSDEELTELYLKIPIIEIWINRVSEYMLSSAVNGKNFKGLKLVEGRSVRAWKDTEQVEQVLKEQLSEDEIYNKKLQGIGAIEKLLGKAKFNELLGDLVVKPQGKPTLVHESDKRGEIGLTSAKNDFAE